jgi:transglutaminase-like putative cysteine protease
MKISIHHLTRYTYPEQVQFTPHRILLRPRENPSLRVLSMDLKVQPSASIKWMVDSFENQIAVAYFEEQSSEILVEANIVTELLTDNPFDFIIEPYAENYPFAYNPSERKALSPYLEVGSPSGCAKVLPWIWKEFPQLPAQSLDLLTQLNGRIHERFQYRRRDEEGVQTPDETISLGSGSCRDFARLFTECCRQLGFAARFVSGYLYDPPTGDDHFQNVAEGSMHACAEVFLPGAGWKGFDSTNGMLANQYFIPCAVANEPKLTSPIQGSYYHSQMRIPSTMEVSLNLERADSAPVNV